MHSSASLEPGLDAVDWVGVKSCWRVGEKGLLRTGERRVDVYADTGSEVGAAVLGFCLEGISPSRFQCHRKLARVL